MHQPTFRSRVATSSLILFFKLLYHSFAWTYDWIAWIVSLGKWDGWIQSILPDLPGQAILEIGHGTGRLQIELSKAGHFVIGVDESRQMGLLAKGKLRRAGHKHRLVRGLAQSLPFSNNTFHHAVSTFPSDYIFDPRTLAEIYRVLLPGGKLVVLPLAWLTGKSWLERLAAGLFHITGQAPEWEEKTLDPFKKAGYKVFAKRRDLNSSQVIVITAQKAHYYYEYNVIKGP